MKTPLINKVILACLNEGKSVAYALPSNMARKTAFDRFLRFLRSCSCNEREGEHWRCSQSGCAIEFMMKEKPYNVGLYFYSMEMKGAAGLHADVLVVDSPEMLDEDERFDLHGCLMPDGLWIEV